MTQELILETAVAGITGYQLSSLYHAQQEPKPFDNRSQEIYECMVEQYLKSNPEIPIEWQVDKLSNGSIRPKNTMRGLDTLSELIQKLEHAKLILDKNLTSDIQGHKSEIINSLIIYLDVLRERHITFNKNITGSSAKHLFGVMPRESRLDGPELMLITEFSLSLINEPVNTYRDIEKRKKFFDAFLTGPISEYENPHKNPFITLQSVSKRIEQIHSILSNEKEDSTLPDLLGNLINGILLLNTKIISLIYSCCLDSKKSFNISKFMSDDQESLDVRKHRTGLALYLVFKELGFKNSMNTDKITKENMNEINRCILSKISISQNNPYSAENSGIRVFISDDKHEKTYDDITNLLRDIAFLYYHIKVLKAIKNTLPTLGIQWGLTNETTKTAIKTILQIAQIAHDRLKLNAKNFSREQNNAIITYTQTINSVPNAYENPNRGITEFNNFIGKHDKTITNLMTTISNNVEKYEETSYVIDEKVTFLNCVFNSTLHCIELEEIYTANKSEFKEIRSQLIQAIKTLPSDVLAEQQMEQKPANDQVFLPVQSTCIAEISDIMTKPERRFALRNIISETYDWRSKVLKEIYNKIITNHAWALSYNRLHAWCWGTYNNENFIKFYDIINTMIRTIENTHTEVQELNTLEYIVKTYVERNQANFFRNPPVYDQKLVPISSTETEENCLVIRSENSACRVPINSLTLEFKEFFSSTDVGSLTQTLHKKKEEVTQLQVVVDELKEKNERNQMTLSEIETLRAYNL